jgi:hypothetical protein
MRFDPAARTLKANGLYVFEQHIATRGQQTLLGVSRGINESISA